MAKKPSETNKPGKDESAGSGSIIVSAAKAIGATVGKVAAITHIASPDAPPPVRRAVKGKYPKQNKSRLPRRQKKALQKGSAAKS